MTKTSKPLSAAMFVLALGLGMGSGLLFASSPLGSLAIVNPCWPLTSHGLALATY